LFARILRLMRQLQGATVISIDPYQLGHENEEGIESGAFWFYRKLGFRSVRPELMKLTLAEERRIKANPNHRTSLRTLRKISAGHMLLDTAEGKQISSAWDKFEARNIGFAVQRRISRDFNGNPGKFRVSAAKLIAGVLGSNIDAKDYSRTLGNFASVLMLIPDLPRWSGDEKRLLARIIQAKEHRSESLYLKLTQRHQRLRVALIQLGS